MNKKLLVGIAAGVGALSLTLAGCASGGSTSPTTGGGDTPVKGGTITWLDVTGQWEATDPAGVYLGGGDRRSAPHRLPRPHRAPDQL